MVKNLFPLRKKSVGAPPSTEGSTSTNVSTVNNPADNRETSPNDFTDVRTTSKNSFQFSADTHTMATDSLFSSKKTLSTGTSSLQSYHWNAGKEQPQMPPQKPVQKQVSSVGLPLRVLHEEELEEDEVPTGTSGPEIVDDKRSLFHRQSFNRWRSEDNYSIKTDRSAVSGGFPSVHSTEGITPVPMSAVPSIADETITGSNEAAGGVATGIISGGAMTTDDELELQQLMDYIQRQLTLLANAVSNILIQVTQSVLNVTKAAINTSEAIQSTCQTVSATGSLWRLPPYQFNTGSSTGLRRLIKSVLYMLDTLLVGEAYANSRTIVQKNLYHLFSKLKLVEPVRSNSGAITSYSSMMAPLLFPFGATGTDFPNEEKVHLIMEKLMSKPKELFSDQDGSFLAPVLRGFVNENLAVITFVFGFPDPAKEHTDVMKYFATNSDDMHFMVMKDGIIPAAATGATATGAGTATSGPRAPPSRRTSIPSKASKAIRFKSPFRTLPACSEYVPISMSIASDNAVTTSGTLGGYVYPKVPQECSNPKLLKYRGSIFGLTCAHVASLGGSNSKAYPNVSVPSPVLINLYKDALARERLKYDVNSAEYSAYDQAVQRIDEEYPVQEVRVMKNRRAPRNLPQHKFGQVVWGERIIHNDKLSDIAMIKINDKKHKKYLNYLGEDLDLTQYDPGLILSNLYVKQVVGLQERKNGIFDHANLPVFKVGSTTSYTRGNLNGMKMIYWSDGSLKTSEFIVSASNKKDFAAGGDSGALILTKLTDLVANGRQQRRASALGYMPVPTSGRRSVLSSFIENFIPSLATQPLAEEDGEEDAANDNSNGSNGTSTGLGVVGMLHSYDGELKQFGLFTPIEDVLNRLESVTGVSWGVVGCEDETEIAEYDDVKSEDIDSVQ